MCYSSHPRQTKGANSITCLDDASCDSDCSTTSKNAMRALRRAIVRFGVPGQILTDHGSQFTPGRPTPEQARYMQAGAADARDVCSGTCKASADQQDRALPSNVRGGDEPLGEMPKFIECDEKTPNI